MEKVMSHEKFTRRNFINRSIKILAAAVLFPLVFTKSRKAEGKNPESEETQGVTVNIDDKKYSDLKKTGGAAYVQIEGEGKPVIVYRVSEKELVAYSSNCTHAGCKVNLPKKDKVVCPCHNSIFDVYGKRISGPAREDLKKFSAELQGSTITITRS